MLCRVSLRLAPTPRQPQGSDDVGYEINAPLDRRGFLDPAEYKARRGPWRVARFARGEPHRYGRLVYRSGAKGRGMWAIDYGLARFADDEDAYGLDECCFEVGGCVRLRDSHGAFQPFRVVRVVPLTGGHPRSSERPSAA